MKTLDANTVASFPGQVKLSREKLRVLQPELNSLFAWFPFVAKNSDVYPRRSYWLTHIEEHLWYGDSRAAVVVSTSPLLVAAYTDEIDCVAILRFDDQFSAQYELQTGSRLLSVNTYYSTNLHAKDLKPGPDEFGRWGNFAPFIAEFLSDDLDRIEERKREIDESEWERAESLGTQYLSENPSSYREGAPLLCNLPAKRIGPKKPAVVTSFDVFKHFMVLTGLIGFTVLSLAAKSLLGLTLFGAFSLLAGWETAKICKRRLVHTSLRENLGSSFRWLVTMVVTILLGLGGEWISRIVSGRRPHVAIWVAAFVSAVAFFPFRGKQKSEIPTFALWLLYCALGSVASVGVSILFAWWW